MRDLAIAYGNNRQAKQWVNKTIKYEDLKDRLKVTIRTSESAEEYAKFSKAQRDAAKDRGGFVAGALKDGRRKVDSVESRSMVALDGDRIDTEFLNGYEEKTPYTSALYTTHSSTPENPRVRILFPLTRDVTPEEYVGDVIGDFNRRRGKVEGMESKAGSRVIKAKVPLAEKFGYVTVLRTLTSGRATSTMEFSHYEEVPEEIAKRIVEITKGKIL